MSRWYYLCSGDLVRKFEMEEEAESDLVTLCRQSAKATFRAKPSTQTIFLALHDRCARHNYAKDVLHSAC